MQRPYLNKLSHTVIFNGNDLVITDAELYGATDSHIQFRGCGNGMHNQLEPAWENLSKAAESQGFHLQIASGFRSLSRQKLIWERKLRGELAVYGDQGESIDLSNLTLSAQIHAIMRWSALPGASRHHWGTDFDIYDKAAVPEAYQLQLTVDEYSNDGPFAPMIAWLRDYLKETPSLGFFFPYSRDHGGIAVEPWHISYRPLASVYQSLWSKVGLSKVLAGWGGIETVVLEKNIDEIYDRYIKHSLIL